MTVEKFLGDLISLNIIIVDIIIIIIIITTTLLLLLLLGLQCNVRKHITVLY